MTIASEAADEFWAEVASPYRPPVFLPDIGTFFNQDSAKAERLIEQIVQAGARYLKGEILHDPSICLDTSADEPYLSAQGQPLTENYYTLVARKVVSLETYAKLFEPLKQHHIGLVLSVYDFAGADFAVAQGACALKIASTNLVHAPLIRHCAQTGLPLIIDTGKAVFNEVTRALDWAKQAGATRIVLEYSPPAPPAPVEKHNLSVLCHLKSIHKGPIGLSDHHSGEEMLYAATALGCRVLEKGICLDDQTDDQDVYHALPAGQFADVLTQCQNIHAALGSAEAAYPKPPHRPQARMGLVSTKALKKGHRVQPEDLHFAFPTVGIGVEHWDDVIDAEIIAEVEENSPLEWQHVQFERR